MTIASTARSYLEQHGTPYELLAHPRTQSSHESAAAAHVPDDHIAKAVMLCDDQGYVMAVIPADGWVRVHAVADALGRALVVAPEDKLTELFPDCRAGAIPPLGNAYGMPVALDEALASLADVYFEAGDHEHLVHVNGADFLRLSSGSRHGHFGHPD